MNNCHNTRAEARENNIGVGDEGGWNADCGNAWDFSWWRVVTFQPGDCGSNWVNLESPGAMNKRPLVVLGYIVDVILPQRLFHKPWHKDPVIKQICISWKVRAALPPPQKKKWLRQGSWSTALHFARLGGGCCARLIGEGFWAVTHMTCCHFEFQVFIGIKQGSLNYPFWCIKQCKCMAILINVPSNNALFGLVI